MNELQVIQNKIYEIRGQKVTTLAELQAKSPLKPRRRVGFMPPKEDSV